MIKSKNPDSNTTLTILGKTAVTARERTAAISTYI
jgi:hypothetical protein